MSLPNEAIAICVLCTLMASPMTVRAGDQVPQHPAKAAPTAPLKRSSIVDTLIGKPTASVLAHKPPVVTAVERKPRTGSNSELNPQPIPPGHGGPVDPSR